MKILKTITFLAITASLINSACTEKTEETENPVVINEPLNDIFTAREHMGVCYGPFHYTGQNTFTQVPLSQIQADLDMIKKNFSFIRTYTVSNGLDKVIQEASNRKMEIAVGVHCTPGDETRTKAEIDLAVSECAKYKQYVSAIVIGNETNLDGNNYVADATVAGYMDYAKSKMNANNIGNITVSSCITGTGGLDKIYYNSHPCPMIMQKCRDLNGTGKRVIYMTIYPYYGQKNNNENHPADISANMKWSHENGMAQAEALGMDVVIAEIGWPSKGDDDNMESVGNEQISFNTTLKWINGNNIYNKSYNTLWFSMFDEPWKTGEPHNAGPHWGLYAADAAPQPKFPIPALY